MFGPVFNIKNFPNIVYMLITYLLYNLKSFILSKHRQNTLGEWSPQYLRKFIRRWPPFAVLFICLFISGCAGSLLLRSLSLAVESGGTFWLWCTGFSLCWLLSLCSTGSGTLRLQQLQQWAQQRRLPGSRAQAQQRRLPGSRAQAQQWRHTGLAALWHAGSSQIRDWTCVSYTGRWILYHWPKRSPTKLD